MAVIASLAPIWGFWNPVSPPMPDGRVRMRPVAMPIEPETTSGPQAGVPTVGRGFFEMDIQIRDVAAGRATGWFKFPEFSTSKFVKLVGKK